MAPTARTLNDELILAIEGLSEHAGPARLRDLLLAEARDRGRPELEVDVSSNVRAADGGIDAVTTFPFPLERPGVPDGRLIWQVKTGRSKPSASQELGSGAKHDAAQQEIRRGANYVVVWTAEPTRIVRENLKSDFLRAAQALRKDATVDLVVARDLAEWAWQHPTLMYELIPLGGLSLLPPLDGTEVENGTSDVEHRIRVHLQGTDVRSLRIIGPPGQGKSTAIRLAANSLDPPIDVLFAPSPAEVSREVVGRFVHHRTRLGIVVESCSPQETKTLETHVQTSHGLLRLITEGEGSASGYPPPTALPRDELEVQPMMPARLIDVLARHGVPPAAAQEFAIEAAGNPLLAVTRATGAEAAGVLGRLLTGLDARALAALALMPPHGVGAPDLARIAQVFEVSQDTLERTCEEIQTRRLGVSQYRYRLASAVATHAVSRSLGPSRAQWLHASVERLPTDAVGSAVAVLGPCGPAAHNYVLPLLDRLERTRSTSEHEIDEALDRIVIASNVAPAAPAEAADLLRAAIYAFPWHEESYSPLALQDTVAAVERIRRAEGPDGIDGASVLLLLADVIDQSWAVRVPLRKQLELELPAAAARLGRLAAKARQIGGVAQAALLVAAADLDDPGPIAVELALREVHEAADLAAYAGYLVARAMTGTNAGRSAALKAAQDVAWRTEQRALFAVAAAVAGESDLRSAAGAQKVEDAHFAQALLDVLPRTLGHPPLGRLAGDASNALTLLGEVLRDLPEGSIMLQRTLGDPDLPRTAESELQALAVKIFGAPRP